MELNLEVDPVYKETVRILGLLKVDYLESLKESKCVNKY